MVLRLAVRAAFPSSSSATSAAALRLFPTRAFHPSPSPRSAPNPAAKPSIALISQIRARRPGTPLSLARSALVASANDLDAALAWIADQAVSSGAAKAKKLEGRTATEGLVGVALLADGFGGTGVRAAMVELSCETDFVARTDEFGELLEQITRSVAFFAEPSSSSSTPFVLHPLETLHDVPLVPLPSAPAEPTPLSTSILPTISTSIAALVSRLGENISLRRALSVALDPVLPRTQTHLASFYVHGATATGGDATFHRGTLASLLILRLPASTAKEKTPSLVRPLARALARQVVAVPTSSVRGAGSVDEPSTALYEQPLLTLGSTEEFSFDTGSSVGQVLELWSRQQHVGDDGLQVVELARWQVGVEAPETTT